MWQRKYYVTILIVLLATSALTSCSKKDTPENANAATTAAGAKARTTANSATLNIHLMDDPGKYDAVNIDIKNIRVQLDDSTWDTVALFRPGIYNLLNFKDDVDTLITSTLLPPGRIIKMEMAVGTDNSVVVRGTTYPLTLRSSTDSSIRIWLRFRHDGRHEGYGFGIGGRSWDRDIDDEDFDEGGLPMVAGGVYDVYADFDVAMSVFNTNGHGFFDWDRDRDHHSATANYILRPVVRAYVKTNTGRLTGQVLPVAAMSTVYASNATDIFTAMPDSGGHFTFPMLPEGSYEIIVTPGISTYTSDTLTAVTVTANMVTRLGVITLH